MDPGQNTFFIHSDIYSINRRMKEFQLLYDSYFIKPATSIMHNPFRLFLLENNLFEPILKNQTPVDVQDEFLEFYPEWITSSELNSFQGLGDFPHKFVSLGVTQGIDDFILYITKKNLRLRFNRGEYGYGIEIAKNGTMLDQEPLKSGDALIISCPFSASGDIHPQWDCIIKTCNDLEIPVFVDAAFFGACTDIKVKLNEPCIDTVSFSPTKGLNCGNMRTGITFTRRSGKDCSLDILSRWHHGIHLNTYIAYNLMKNFSPDTIPNTYRNSQIEVCKHYGLTPSKTLMFGLGNEGWEHFSRNGFSNRVNVRSAIMDHFMLGTMK